MLHAAAELLASLSLVHLRETRADHLCARITFLSLQLSLPLSYEHSSGINKSFARGNESQLCLLPPPNLPHSLS